MRVNTKWSPSTPLRFAQIVPIQWPPSAQVPVWARKTDNPLKKAIFQLPALTRKSERERIVIEAMHDIAAACNYLQDLGGVAVRQSLEINLCSHRENSGFAAAGSRSGWLVQHGVDVVELELCVGIQIPIQSGRDVVQSASLNVLIVQVQVGPTSDDFPRADATLFADVAMWFNTTEDAVLSVVRA